MSGGFTEIMTMGTGLGVVAIIINTVVTVIGTGQELVNSNIGDLTNATGQLIEQKVSAYNNKIVNGSAVKTALTQQGSNVAILIQTVAFRNIAVGGEHPFEEYALNYGCLLTADGKSSTPSNMPTKKTYTVGSTDGSENFLNGQCTSAYLVKFTKGTDPTGYGVYKDAATPYYIGQKHTTNGVSDTSFMTGNVTDQTSAACVLDQASFQANLIKNLSGILTGLLFVQVQGA